ncbi:penicillin acylase family protein [Nocardioides convexus]|uniref:penicillin acylase family protein n=1 Tax=Nocardioides convexus TaxID=2712224 RepID=UPI0024188096|nr:penicillin acylase family protein [Nocardioides convexus]
MITRDAWGIPQVSAGSVLEVAREQGRVTARDRGWQARGRAAPGRGHLRRGLRRVRP